MSELSWFTLTIHGAPGPAATSAGTAGACYIPSPGEMPGGVLLRKAKARIYPEVLKDAEGPLPAAASAPSSNPTSLSRQKVFEFWGGGFLILV